MDAADDAVLAGAIARGDHSAFEQLRGRYKNRVSRIAMAILWGKCVDPPDHSQQIGQDVWLKIFEKSGLYKSSEGSFSAWLGRIVINASIDHLKKACDYQNKSTDDLTVQGLLGDRSVGDAESRICCRILLQSLMAQLTENDRVLVKLIYIRGFSNKEIAQLLNVNENAVKQRKFRLKGQLEKLGHRT
jgi:RNA polymerase sigma-70 factor (ECF subfamily)